MSFQVGMYVIYLQGTHHFQLETSHSAAACLEVTPSHSVSHWFSLRYQSMSADKVSGLHQPNYQQLQHHPSERETSALLVKIHFTLYCLYSSLE